MTEPRTVGRAWLIVVVVVLLAGLLIVGLVPRLKRREAMARAKQEATAPRRVVVSPVVAQSGPTSMTLPGSANAFRATGVYAKASGFVRRVAVDLGDRVRAGQVLVELDVPENDEEIRRLKAQVDVAEANASLSEANARRNERLTQDGIVSLQQAEQARAQANSAQAATRTSRAELQRLAALQGYQRVTAPFAGVVSRRVVEPGQLVSVGTGAAGPGALLLEVSDTDKLRVFFDVPQALAADLAVGQEAAVFLPSAPARAIQGKVVRTSGALDPSTRTLRAEVDIDGNAGILAGAFVNVRLAVPRRVPALTIPAAALSIRKEGPRVAVVEGSRVRWTPVTLGRDLGKEVEVTSGVVADQKVVLNVPDDLGDGEEVRATERPQR